MTPWRQLFWLSGAVLVVAATVGVALLVGAAAWALNLIAAVQLLGHDDRPRPLLARARPPRS